MPIAKYNYDENVRIDGFRIYPNETNLYFYSNGHSAKSAFLRTFISKCQNSTDTLNPEIKCASPKEIDDFINELEIDFYFEF